MNFRILLAVIALLLSLETASGKPSITSDFATCNRQYKKMGCFEDKNTDMDMILDDRDVTSQHHQQGHVIDWDQFQNSIHSLACRCSALAREGGYTYFSIRFWGECFAGRDHDQLEMIIKDDSKRSSQCANHLFQHCDDTHSLECVGKGNAEYMYSLTPPDIDGGYSAWTVFGPCSKGLQIRERTCTNPEPKGPRAKDCSVLGDSTETRQCEVKECPGCLGNISKILDDFKKELRGEMIKKGDLKDFVTRAELGGTQKQLNDMKSELKTVKEQLETSKDNAAATTTELNTTKKLLKASMDTILKMSTNINSTNIELKNLKATVEQKALESDLELVKTRQTLNQTNSVVVDTEKEVGEMTKQMKDYKKEAIARNQLIGKNIEGISVIKIETSKVVKNVTSLNERIVILEKNKNDSDIKNWPSGSFCIFKSGSCPSGFVHRSGWYEVKGNGYIKPVTFGDSKIFQNGPIRWTRLSMEICCK